MIARQNQNNLNLLYQSILSKVSDVSFQNSIKAQLNKQLAFFVAIEEKTIRLEKKKNEAAIRQIQKIKNTLFPNNLLQERYDNFIPYYLNYGENLFKKLKNNFDPLHPNFVILRI